MEQYVSFFTLLTYMPRWQLLLHWCMISIHKMSVDFQTHFITINPVSPYGTLLCGVNEMWPLCWINAALGHISTFCSPSIWEEKWWWHRVHSFVLAEFLSEHEERSQCMFEDICTKWILSCTADNNMLYLSFLLKINVAPLTFQNFPNKIFMHP